MKIKVTCKLRKIVDGYRWHDVTKNMKDLPKNGSEVIIMNCGELEDATYYDDDYGPIWIDEWGGVNRLCTVEKWKYKKGNK